MLACSDEIFETSISSPSDNLDKVDEALRVMTKENKVSLLAEFSTPIVRHAKGKELKRIEKSSEPVYDESSFYSLSGRSSNYDSKDDAANRESEGFSIKKRKAELLYESHKKRKLSSPVSTSHPVQGGVGIEVEKAGGNDVGVEMVGGDDVGVEMVGVDFEKVGGDYVGGETVGVDFEKVGGDYVGGETIGLMLKN
ncbi:hypothetical protein F0562_005158 [Nyssa sinensis]|uniref:Uncharacterized protein n=1 Tax=Nyssa sinensis TaxID=561372 RepID=A0A5J5AJX3_9ASTE|nr:hypothetical protein F0562_005158 [Nyssa sinensis]